MIKDINYFELLNSIIQLIQKSRFFQFVMYSVDGPPSLRLAIHLLMCPFPPRKYSSCVETSYVAVASRKERAQGLHEDCGGGRLWFGSEGLRGGQVGRMEMFN